MANLKELKNRIVSVKNTQKITKAKQMVAAAKLRRAQEAAEASKPYAMRMAAVIANLTNAASGGQGPKLLTGTGKDDVHLVIVMTAERGLCGGFNSNVVKRAREEITRLKADGKEVKIITIGKKGREQLVRTHGNMLVEHIDTSSSRGSDDLAEIALELGKNLTKAFDEGQFDVATLIYSQFRNVISQVPIAKRMVPAEPPEETPLVDLKGATYLYEPSEEGILEALLPRYINTQLLSALLESAAGEQAASMTAMDNATRNAGELIEKLTLKYNRARQAQITTELIEIIAGAEAL